jgi:hypothetical protein
LVTGAILQLWLKGEEVDSLEAKTEMTMSIRYDSVEELAHALRRAAELHNQHARLPGSDDDWPLRYAQHMADDQRPRPAGTERYRHLPAHLRPDQLVASHPVSPPPDPDGGRDTERDFMLRYGAGGDASGDVGDG